MRKEMIKFCHKRREEAKSASGTFDATLMKLPASRKPMEIIAEDIMKKLEKNIQELTDKFCKEADDISEKKEKEISTFKFLQKIGRNCTI